MTDTNNDTIETQKALTKAKFEQHKEAEDTKGVVYMSRVPPYMKVSYIREYFKRYKPLRIYLTPEKESIRKDRVKKGGNRKVKFEDGWIEFEDKRVAKYVAANLNGSQVGGKKKHYYYEDMWN